MNQFCSPVQRITYCTGKTYKPIYCKNNTNSSIKTNYVKPYQMSLSIRDLELQEAHALGIAAYLRKQINQLQRPEKKPNAKLIAINAKAEKIRLKRLGR